MSEQAVPPSTSDAPHTSPGVPAPPVAGVQPPPPAQSEQSSGGGKRKIFSIVGAIVAFAVVAGLKFGIGSLRNSDEAAEAKIGDCIAELSATNLGEKETKVDGAKVVACTDSQAVYNVVGRVDGQTEAQARSDEACDEYFTEGDDGYVFYSIKPGSTGYLLCLTKRA
ncbi:hypothetical protein Vqi01_37710 [Micromonospora qiuiae]|uniref:Porin n=1 Tax=Micromonospora qiuiae TaxID=502268 RepID=A0ABQ4JEM2_9ACTN|nr:hypothetical protein [Micromonospora qiuiae]GIJ28609.1 hypothetical protein Vqi01_37710 [Micromonospora qiuiae]